MKIRFIIEIYNKYDYFGKDEFRTFRVVDDTDVNSIETAEIEIKKLIDKFNEEEKNNYGEKAGSRKLLRIIDEEKLKKCPTELIWDSYMRQELQGECSECGYKFIDFFNRGKQKPENFKHCLGFGQSRVKNFDRVIVFECPKCFLKSQFHCNDNWYDLYGEWIVDNSIFLKDEKNNE